MPVTIPNVNSHESEKIATNYGELCFYIRSLVDKTSRYVINVYMSFLIVVRFDILISNKIKFAQLDSKHGENAVK